MKKHVVTGPICRLSQCHPTITNSYSYSWIRNQMFLLIHFEIQELWVIITTNTRTRPEKFREILQISRRFSGFPGRLCKCFVIFVPQHAFHSHFYSILKNFWFLSKCSHLANNFYFLLVFILVDGNQRYLFLFLLCSVKYHRTKVANVTHDIVFALINQLTGNADKEQTL